ncbi:MAG TPA: methyltransferase domain-containing protein [Blastocatellia bacterium]|nr:methyltransferase domain-containing protein [Blastocatellia bacterium]
MMRREDATILDTGQSVSEEMPKLALPRQKRPLIATWLSQFEEQIANDFRRRTGLDYKSTIATIIEAAEPFPGMKVVDVPTGTGIIARQFVGKVGEKGRIVGVEETRDKLEQARLAAQSAKLSLHIEWRAMSLEKLFFESNSLDLITSVMAFHRMQSEKFLAEAYRVLKPGGRLLIADEMAPEIAPTSFMQSARRNFYRYIRRDKSEANARFYTTDEMMKMLNDVGFGRFMFRALRQRSKHDRIFTLIKSIK